MMTVRIPLAHPSLLYKCNMRTATQLVRGARMTAGLERKEGCGMMLLLLVTVTTDDCLLSCMYSGAFR